jgi:uncharacterized protein (TIGR02588 family)
MSTQDRHQAAREPGQHERGRRTPAEWTTLIIVLVIMSGLIGSLLWFELQAGEDAATFQVQVLQAQIEERAGAFYVPLRVQNTGAATAEDVVVRVELTHGEQVPDEAELVFRFLAGGESAEGVAVFSRDPRTGTLDASVTSYLQP